MKVRVDQPAPKRRTNDPRNIRSSKPKAPETEWELADDRLDEALRKIFPAGDALSIVQGTGRC